MDVELKTRREKCEMRAQSQLRQTLYVTPSFSYLNYGSMRSGTKFGRLFTLNEDHR